MTHLRVVRAAADPPKLPLPRPRAPRPRWVDAPWVGPVIAAVLFLGAGLIGIAMRWLP